MYMFTSSYILRKEYEGKAYRILQKGWEHSENYAKEHGLFTYQTGGSVTTTALDIGISFNCKEILYMGMDMAYINGASHANMRGLLYFARQYEIYIAENEYNIFGIKWIAVSAPRYVIFYNGNSWKEE